VFDLFKHRCRRGQDNLEAVSLPLKPPDRLFHEPHDNEYKYRQQYPIHEVEYPFSDHAPIILVGVIGSLLPALAWSSHIGLWAIRGSQRPDPLQQMVRADIVSMQSSNWQQLHLCHCDDSIQY